MKKKTVNELNQELTRIDAEYAEYERRARLNWRRLQIDSR